MIGGKKKQMAFSLACALLLGAFSLRRCVAAESSVPAAETGETLLPAGEVDKVLAELPALKSQGCVAARIVTDVDGLRPVKGQEGELLLDRPNRVLRKFTKPSPNFWLLDGTRLQEYVSKNNTLYINDFTLAPRKLKLIQAAFTGDLKALQGLFNIWVFKRPSAGQGKPVEYRFVLMQKPEADKTLGFNKVQLRASEKDLFFHEIEIDMPPDKGDHTIERYFDIASVIRPSEKDFQEALGLPADAAKKVEQVEDDPASKKE